MRGSRKAEGQKVKDREMQFPMNVGEETKIFSDWSSGP